MKLWTECKNVFKMTTAQKTKFSIKDFSSKCDQIRTLKKSLKKNFIFYPGDSEKNSAFHCTSKSLIKTIFL